MLHLTLFFLSLSLLYSPLLNRPDEAEESNRFSAVSYELLTEKEELMANARRYLPNQAQQEALIYEIKRYEPEYDPETQLIQRYIPAHANRYHSALVDTTLHPLRQSASYAADLMDSGVPEYQQRAFGIFKQIIAYQDQQKSSKTYGIWPYHAEEPLAQMNKPDWNWADFIGVSLLETYMKHHDDLPRDLRKSMEEAIVHASYSVRKRDVKPGYTNIAIMGTLVTYLTAHLFDLPDLKDYADMRLRRFYDYTVALSGFAEYNSPNYTKVALDELCRMRQYILEPEALRMVDYCYETGWKVLATHFHPPSGQLAGPHSRSYGTLLRRDFYHFLYGASDGMVNYPKALLATDYYTLQHNVPEDLLPYFTELTQARIEIDTFGVDDNPVVGYTYLHPKYCLGTANRSTTWQQRRPLVAYWGTPWQPRYLQPRLLRDGVDFAAGNIFSVQQHNRALTTLGLAVDGGDYLISIDRLPDGVFQTQDLRLRFEMGGADLYRHITIEDNQVIRIEDGDVRLDIQLLQAMFDGRKVDKIEKGKDQDRSWVDLIIHTGTKKKFDLKRMEQVSFGWSTHIYANEDQPRTPTASVAETRKRLMWDEMQLLIPTEPATEETLQRNFATQ